MCQKIRDPFRQMPQAFIILVQCGAMVSSSAVDATSMGSAACQQIWDLFWQLPQEVVIPKRCGAMVKLVCFGDNSLRQR